MALAVPNPNVPTNGQALDASPLLANLQAVYQAIQSFDASQIAAGTLVASAFNASINPNTLLRETTVPFVSTGCVWSIVSGLTGLMTAGVIYINGIRVSVNSISSNVFTASRDTYIDIDVNGNVTYQAVTNGSAAPSLTANSIRVAKVITGASISSIVQSGQDSLGNAIYPRIPYSYGLGVVTQLTNSTTTSTAYTPTLADGVTSTVAINIGNSGEALVNISSYNNNGAGNFNFTSFSATGANTIAASDNNALLVKFGSDIQAGITIPLQGLTQGLTVFTIQYKVSAGTGTFGVRRLSVQAL